MTQKHEQPGVLLNAFADAPQQFEGSWLLPPNDLTRSREQAWSTGWCWGVAEDPRGHLVVYRFHITRKDSPVLTSYATPSKAILDGVPRDILALALRSARRKRTVA